MNNYKEAVVTFILRNGWTQDSGTDMEYTKYSKANTLSIVISDSEVVLVRIRGSLIRNRHIILDHNCLYTLIGFMVHHEYLPSDYLRGPEGGLHEIW